MGCGCGGGGGSLRARRPVKSFTPTNAGVLTGLHTPQANINPEESKKIEKLKLRRDAILKALGKPS